MGMRFVTLVLIRPPEVVQSTVSGIVAAQRGGGEFVRRAVRSSRTGGPSPRRISTADAEPGRAAWNDTVTEQPAAGASVAPPQRSDLIENR
jgi:hypothetical protein